MKYKNNKGVTGVDLSVSLIIVVLFVGIISALVYNFGTTSKNINRKSIATNIATQKIENLKRDFINNTNDAEGTIAEYAQINESTGNIVFFDAITDVNKTPYRVATKITKFANYTESSYIQNLSPEDKNRILQENLIKIVEVTVYYNIGNSEENVQIKTAITRED